MIDTTSKQWVTPYLCVSAREKKRERAGDPWQDKSSLAQPCWHYRKARGELFTAAPYHKVVLRLPWRCTHLYSSVSIPSRFPRVTRETLMQTVPNASCISETADATQTHFTQKSSALSWVTRWQKTPPESKKRLCHCHYYELQCKHDNIVFGRICQVRNLWIKWLRYSSITRVASCQSTLHHAETELTSAENYGADSFQ